MHVWQQYFAQGDVSPSSSDPNQGEKRRLFQTNLKMKVSNITQVVHIGSVSQAIDLSFFWKFLSFIFKNLPPIFNLFYVECES